MPPADFWHSNLRGVRAETARKAMVGRLVLNVNNVIICDIKPPHSSYGKQTQGDRNLLKRIYKVRSTLPSDAQFCIPAAYLDLFGMHPVFIFRKLPCHLHIFYVCGIKQEQWLAFFRCNGKNVLLLLANPIFAFRYRKWH